MAAVRFDGEDFRMNELVKRVNKRTNAGVSFRTKMMAMFLIAAVVHFQFIYLLLTYVAVVMLIALFGFPMLLLSRTISLAVSARLVPLIMGKTDDKLHEIRRELLKNIRGRVLDVGCGVGPYLKYYSESEQKVTEVVLLEPNTFMHKQLRAAVDKAKPSYKISIQTEYIEKIKGSFDSIVLGNVLCEIPKWQKAITEVDRLLKPGGRVYFSEHVLDGEGSWRRFFQQKMRPWWFVVSGGCDCARPILDELKKTEWDVKSWTVNMNNALTGRFEIGIAVKASQNGPDVEMKQDGTEEKEATWC